MNFELNEKMQHKNGGQVLPSTPQWNGGGDKDDDDDDDPFTEEDLKAIEAAFQSTSKRSRLDLQRAAATTAAEEGGLYRRRLPNSVLALQHPHPSSIIPCQAKAKMRYPILKFGGKIAYSRTAIEVERASRELLATVEAKRSKMGQVAIGFDIEWKATFRKGVVPGKVAVMQICLDNSHCHVMHITHSGIPKSLKSLLENSTLLKVGVGIGNDAVKVFKDYNITVEAVEELGYLANQKLVGDSQKWSLASLTENLVSKQLLKPKRIQLGNWEANILSKDQLEYAATDAFVSWYLYEVLKTLPNLEKAIAEKSQEVKEISSDLCQ